MSNWLHSLADRLYIGGLEYVDKRIRPGDLIIKCVCFRGVNKNQPIDPSWTLIEETDNENELMQVLYKIAEPHGIEELEAEKDNLRTIADRDLKNITKLESQRDQLAEALESVIKKIEERITVTAPIPGMKKSKDIEWLYEYFHANLKELRTELKRIRGMK